MKKSLTRIICSLLFFMATNTDRVLNMPSSDEDESPSTPSPAKDTNKKPASPNEQKTEAATTPPPSKPKALTWPETVEISEDNKTLLQSNNKEIVQLFTLAQEVCKNMDETLSRLNTQRDSANKKYRDTLKEFDPLLQRIGAAQAENKNRKEIS